MTRGNQGVVALGRQHIGGVVLLEPDPQILGVLIHPVLSSLRLSGGFPVRAAPASARYALDGNDVEPEGLDQGEGPAFSRCSAPATPRSQTRRARSSDWYARRPRQPHRQAMSSGEPSRPYTARRTRDSTSTSRSSSASSTGPQETDLHRAAPRPNTAADDQWRTRGSTGTTSNCSSPCSHGPSPSCTTSAGRATASERASRSSHGVGAERDWTTGASSPALSPSGGRGPRRWPGGSGPPSSQAASSPLLPAAVDGPRTTRSSGSPPSTSTMLPCSSDQSTARRSAGNRVRSAGSQRPVLNRSRTRGTAGVGAMAPARGHVPIGGPRPGAIPSGRGYRPVVRGKSRVMVVPPRSVWVVTTSASCRATQSP